MSNITKYQGAQISSMDDLARFAKMSYESGMFKDLKAVQQAAVKAQVAMELGVSPMLGLSAIHIVEGRPTLSAGMLASLMKRAGYSWRILAHTDVECRLEVKHNGESLGESGFTVEEAKAAGLLNRPNWNKHRRDMLFARAISRAARWFAPEVALGVYTPDEMGEVDHTEQQTYEPIEEESPTTGVVEAEVVEEPAEKTAHSPEWKHLNAKIHAKLKEVGLTHNTLKELLPDGYEIKKASEDQLDALSSLLFAPDLDSLKVVWKIAASAYPNLFDGVKDHMKAQLGGA